MWRVFQLRLGSRCQESYLTIALINPEFEQLESKEIILALFVSPSSNYLNA